MSVPAPSIVPVVVSGGTFRARYEGPVNAVGPLATLNIDLKYLSVSNRSGSNFRPSLQITFESKDADLTFAGPNEILNAQFFDTPGQPNEYVQIQVSSVAGTEECFVLVELVTTPNR